MLLVSELLTGDMCAKTASAGKKEKTTPLLVSMF
jgi:hypothetical protein